jgi:hypothetical protein
MQSVETKTKTGEELLAEAAAGMRSMAKELENKDCFNGENGERLLAEATANMQSLATKLGNDDYFDEVQQAGIDTLNNAIMALPRVEQILMYQKLLGEVGNGWFSEPLSEQQLKEKWDSENFTIDHILGNMRLHLGTYSAKLQQDILIFLLNEMPEKLREQQEEETLNDAVQELLDAIGELPDDEQVGIYKDLTEQIKNREAVAA